MFSRLKRLTKLIAPSFIVSSFQTTKKLFWIKSSKNSKNLNLIKFNKSKNKVAVLGNGPSLQKDLKKLYVQKESYDFICVNNFCSSSYYEKFQPCMYVFLDPYFFSKDAHEDWISQREETFRKINTTTTWPMQIFIPISADESVLKEFIDNKNIDIVKLKVLPYVASSQKKNNLVYRTGYFGPYQCNVLIYAIYIAIWSRYKQAEVYGADLSFHNDLIVDQNNNQVYMKFKHFNSEDYIEPLMRNPQKIEPFTMTDVMKTTADTFRAHEVLNQYSSLHNVKIINASSYSLIDAYNRP